VARWGVSFCGTRRGVVAAIVDIAEAGPGLGWVAW
jgi:hypothetical protein